MGKNNACKFTMYHHKIANGIVQWVEPDSTCHLIGNYTCSYYPIVVITCTIDKVIHFKVKSKQWKKQLIAVKYILRIESGTISA